jgi:hypothetical protein
MKVTIEVLFRRAGEGGTREVGVRGARLLFRLVLTFLALLLALLSVAQVQGECRGIGTHWPWGNRGSGWVGTQGQGGW